MEFKKIENMNIEEGIMEIEKLMVNGILEYLNKGIPQNDKSNCNYIRCLNIVYYFSDRKGDKMCKKLLDYHNKTIENYIVECTKKIISENINLVDEFFYILKK